MDQIDELCVRERSKVSQISLWKKRYVGLTSACLSQVRPIQILNLRQLRFNHGRLLEMLKLTCSNLKESLALQHL